MKKYITERESNPKIYITEIHFHIVYFSSKRGCISSLLFGNLNLNKRNKKWRLGKPSQILIKNQGVSVALRPFTFEDIT